MDMQKVFLIGLKSAVRSTNSLFHLVAYYTWPYKHRYICSNSQQYIGQNDRFFFYAKNHWDHVPWRYFCNCPTINTSKLDFWLVICIAKNFIWTTLKAEDVEI